MSTKQSTDGTTGERAYWPLPKPWPRPWPFPLPPFDGDWGSGNRSVSSASLDISSLDPVLLEGVEVLKRMYAMPDYQNFMKAYGKVLADKFEADPEALKALKELMEEHGVNFESTERIAPLVAGLIVGGGAVVGIILGYLAERGKAN